MGGSINSSIVEDQVLGKQADGDAAGLLFLNRDIGCNTATVIYFPAIDCQEFPDE